MEQFTQQPESDHHEANNPSAMQDPGRVIEAAQGWQSLRPLTTAARLR